MEYRYMLLKSDGNEVHNMAKRNIPDPGGYLASHMRRAEGGLHIKGLFAKKKEEDEPLVSIITVVRNAERHLEKTIQSVIKQTYNNIEYIIIDGASTDGTLGMIALRIGLVSLMAVRTRR